MDQNIDQNPNESRNDGQNTDFARKIVKFRPDAINTTGYRPDQSKTDQGGRCDKLNKLKDNSESPKPKTIWREI